MAQTKTEIKQYENPLQLGGIRTGTLDHPQAGGRPGNLGCPVAWVDTGAGLRFTVAIGRGGDIVDAAYKDTNLAYLTPNGLRAASKEEQQGDDWLHAWAGGLVTTCGPETIGRARVEDGKEMPLHGRYSNTPAELVGMENPDQVAGRDEMSLSLVTRVCDVSVPVFEVRRTIRCKLGVPEIHIHDEVTNVGDTTVAHNWLYHVNLGYPFLDEGAKLVYRGKAAALPFTGKPMSTERINGFKLVPASNPKHAGSGEDNVFVDPPTDNHGLAHVGLVNAKRQLGLELVYAKKQLPRFDNWQSFSPSGRYVTALEPFHGSLLGKDNDPSKLAVTTLGPGEKRSYDLTIRVLDGKTQMDALMKHDGELIPVAGL